MAISIYLSVAILFYNISLFLYRLAIHIAALRNAKAKNWIEGRKNIIKLIASILHPNEKRIWIHCSSLGEFEQGRPIIEAIKEKHPQYKIVLTFFSPSGYLVRKNYQLADYVFYLPMDGKSNAANFIKYVNPSLAIFVKYEFWYYYLSRLKKQNIPTIIVAATFRPSQPFFKWYGGFFRKILKTFDFLFVQEYNSKELLAKIGLNENVIVSGDTRFDRVAAIAKSAIKLPLIETFKEQSQLLIAGSTWQEDEKILAACFDQMPQNWKLIIAPHEIETTRIKQVQSLFGEDAVLYSEYNDSSQGKRILIIDNIGMLSSLYSYGAIAYVGGGFQKGGIHNTLEPAVFGLPVIFGPIYEKFVEAVDLVNKGFGFSIENTQECLLIIQHLITDTSTLQAKQHKIKEYMQAQIGATDSIMVKVSEILQ